MDSLKTKTSFNSMIWERAPKTTYCGYEKLVFAVYDACAHFNYGRQATIDILNVEYFEC